MLGGGCKPQIRGEGRRVICEVHIVTVKRSPHPRHRQLNTNESIWNPNPPAMPLRRCHPFVAMIDVLGRWSAVASRGTDLVRFPLSVLTHCIISVHPCPPCLCLGRIQSCSCRVRYIALLRRPRAAALHTRRVFNGKPRLLVFRACLASLPSTNALSSDVRCRLQKCVLPSACLLFAIKLELASSR